jgi:probable rRNA maturation factor
MARITVSSPRIPGVRTAALRRTARVTLERAAPHVVGDVGIALVSDKRIRDLNRRFRAQDTPTDVLSFPFSAGLKGDEPFGDVIISYETARRQALQYGASLQRELQRLLIHGTLHLCGYDHHERRAAARMHGLTRRLLRAVGDG